jgi:hypothetical protein
MACAPEKKVYKLSFRCYLPGFVSTLAAVRDAIVGKRLHKVGIGSFDIAPYNKNQLLGCVGFYKTEENRRTLIPEYNEPLESFMVQRVTGKERILRYEADGDDSNQTEVEPDDTVDVDVQGSRFAPPWEILKRLVMSLNVQARCVKGSYDAWTRVGWAIAGVARAAKRIDDGFDLWLDFCRQCPGAYNEIPLKAWQVYRGANSRGEQLGWKSLMESLKEDNVDVYNEICGQPGSANAEVITDENQISIIRDFLMTKLLCKPNRISQMMVKDYDDRKVILITSTETYCLIKNDEHSDTDKPLIYYVIGSRSAKEKCRHPECQDKSGPQVSADSYGEALQQIVARLLSVETTTEQAIQKLLQDNYKDDESIRKMNHEIGEEIICDFSLDRYELPQNRYCPIHNCYHDHPENCLILTKNFSRLGIKCRQNAFSHYPPDGLVVPPNVVNIINKGIIVHNHYTNIDSDGGTDSLFDELLPIFDDPELNRLMHISFKGYASDVAQVFYYLGKDRFGVQSGESDTWWAWDTEEMRWIQSSHKANLFCDGELAGKYQKAAAWYKGNIPKDDTKSRRLKQIDYLLKRLKDRDQHSILAQAAIIFKDKKRHFENRLDGNKDIINFKGQIFDFVDMTVRNVRPTDYVSKTTGYALPQRDTEREKAVIDFIESIMPDAAHVDYLLTWLASCLDGWN